ncbi:phage-shock protein [Desulfolucanica intricata]|uniref:phage-shock protein n=1 Tax=Desulfolucanica intricata TaxID=1285191 RepID=UPI0008332013|nr:phage-shock protein [Desulfolucanica intricata]
MENKLQSLTDVLKKNLFFFEALTVAELTQHVHKIMLQDYTVDLVEEKVNLCLRQHPCFYTGQDGLWRINLQGLPENDKFYAFLLKKQQPMSLRDFVKNNSSKKKKSKKELVAEEVSLISDGRFIQWNNGSWSLTEWEVEASNYSLRQIIIKAMKIHPGGLSIKQLFEIVQVWRQTTPSAVEGVLKKYPYFEQVSESLWCYNPEAQVLYENFMKRYLGMVQSQKERWHRDRERWHKKVKLLESQLQEVSQAQREAAAALAEQREIVDQHEKLVTQMAEKDLLLSLRKKEIIRYREHLNKLDAKSNSILHQCRLWVKRTEEANLEIQRLKDLLAKNQSSQESLFVKLQQYKEKDRENKQKLADIQDKYSTKVAELQTEIVELKQKLEKQRILAQTDEKHWQEQINQLTNDLKNAYHAGEELQKSLRLVRQELKRTQAQHEELKKKLAHPLVKFVGKICGIFRGQARESAQNTSR